MEQKTIKAWKLKCVYKIERPDSSVMDCPNDAEYIFWGKSMCKLHFDMECHKAKKEIENIKNNEPTL